MKSTLVTGEWRHIKHQAGIQESCLRVAVRYRAKFSYKTPCKIICFAVTIGEMMMMMMTIIISKVFLVLSIKAHCGAEIHHSFLTWALDKDEYSALRSGCFTTVKQHFLSLEQETGWSSEPDWIFSRRINLFSPRGNRTAVPRTCRS
jgi:hypothetical protein